MVPKDIEAILNYTKMCPDRLHTSDLYPSSQYGIWVYALNAVGFRNRDPVYATTGDPEPPSPVRDLSVTDITETGAIVTWSHPVTQGTYALQTYRVYVEYATHHHLVLSQPLILLQMG